LGYPLQSILQQAEIDIVSAPFNIDEIDFSTAPQGGGGNQKVFGDVHHRSLGPISGTMAERWSPAVAELQSTAYFTPQKFAKSCSKASTSGP